MQSKSVGYVLGFCFTICFVCSVIVAGTAVGLKQRQEINKQFDRQKKVLLVAGLMKKNETPTHKQVQTIFKNRIKAVIIDLRKGEIDPKATSQVDSFDPAKARNDPATSRPAPKNLAGIRRLPHQARIFLVSQTDLSTGKGDFKISQYIFPIEGKGLWSTLYGYIALAPDLNEVLGITFYEHGETPGLGGEIDNPSWKEKWNHRLIFGARGSKPKTWKKVRIKVKKGLAGTPTSDPHQVDGISGATITSNGVTNLVRFWLGKDGFGPFIQHRLQRHSKKPQTHQKHHKSQGGQ